MKKSRVLIHGTQSSTVTVENGATVGARFSENIYDEDGNVLSLAALIAMAQGAAPPPVSVSAWGVLLDIPPNVKALEDATGSTGMFAVTGPSTGALHTMQGPASVKITNANGVAGPPSFELDGDEVTPAANKFYGTDPGGALGYNLFGDGELARLSGSTYTSLQHFVNVMHSPGLITGGEFSNATGGTMDVAAGTMMIRVADDDVSTLLFADFPAATVTIPADSLARFIGVEYNAGNPQVVVKTTNTWNQDTEFPLGVCANTGTFMFPFYNPFKVGDPLTNIIQRFDAQAQIIRDSAVAGLELGNVATRTATLTAGRAWTRLNDHPITAKNSGTETLVGIRPGPGGTVQLTTGLTQWPNTQYTDPTGTLVTMGNNKWAVLWYFVNVGTNAWGFAYGTAEYNNAAAAALEQIPSYLSAAFLANNLLLGRMLFEKSVDTPIVESAFTRVFDAAAVSDHNQLSNLQGGQLAEYYHLTAAEHTKVQALPASSQPLDATLTALSGADWSLNALPIGSGADQVSQVAFAANTFPARASTGNLVAKAITDFGLALLDDATASDARTTIGAVNKAGDAGVGILEFPNGQVAIQAPGGAQLSTGPAGATYTARGGSASGNSFSVRTLGGSSVADFGTVGGVTSSFYGAVAVTGIITSSGVALARFSAQSTGGITAVLSSVDAVGQGTVGTLTNHPFGIYSNDALRALFENNGNIGLHGGASYGSGVKVLFIGNATTAPTTNPTGGGILYFDSGSGKVRTPGGNVVTIAPNTAPSVTGSRGGNAALASLLTTLAAAGIIADNTTA